MPPLSHQRVALFGDQPIMLAGLGALVGAVPGTNIIGVPLTMFDAVEFTRSQSPDVAIISIGTLRPAGLAFLRRILGVSPLILILLVCDDRDARSIKAAFRLGIAGYLLNGASIDGLQQALRAVRGGGLYLDGGLEVSLLMGSMPSGPSGVGDDLSTREMQVLRLVVSSNSNKSIADQTGLSVRSVETYRFRACRKLGLSSRGDIIRYGSDRGWALF
jgi:DNA-binding NarL/FixJ family response regulator